MSKPTGDALNAAVIGAEWVKRLVKLIQAEDAPSENGNHYQSGYEDGLCQAITLIRQYSEPVAVEQGVDDVPPPSPDKVMLIKLYREKWGCSLLQARNAVESFLRPATQATGRDEVSAEIAEEMIPHLEAAAGWAKEIAKNARFERKYPPGYSPAYLAKCQAGLRFALAAIQQGGSHD